MLGWELSDRAHRAHWLIQRALCKDPGLLEHGQEHAVRGFVPHVRLRLQRFAAVVMRIREPKTTALIFASGKMVSKSSPHAGAG
eukprot:86396-Chlamydomonas_euryale.AAC.22